MRRFLSLIGVAALVATPALAHGPVGAEPGPGATVGGEITEIRIVFPELMSGTDMMIALTAPDGSEVDPLGGPTLQDDQQVARVEIAPLHEAGTYRVDYSVGGIDDVRTPGAYEFSFEPTAEPPAAVLVPEPILTAGSPNWRAFALGVIAAALLAGFVVRARRLP